MAKKQTRRSISVSRTTYERLKAFCEANNISMSQLVETRVNDFLGDGPTSEHGAGAGSVHPTSAPTPRIGASASIGNPRSSVPVASSSASSSFSGSDRTDRTDRTAPQVQRPASQSCGAHNQYR